MVLLLEVEDPSVAGARVGDRGAWADLYERFHPIIERYLQVTNPAGLADVDEMWADAARALPGEPEGIEPLIWLLRSVRDTAAVCPSSDDADDPAIRAVRSLDPIEMDVIALRVIAGLSEEDVALLVGRPVGRVRAAGHQGVAHLIRDLEAG